MVSFQGYCGVSRWKRLENCSAFGKLTGMFVNVHQVGLDTIIIIHITQPSAKYMYLIATFHSPMANFIRHMITWRWRWARDQNMVIGRWKVMPDEVYIFCAWLCYMNMIIKITGKSMVGRVWLSVLTVPILWPGCVVNVWGCSRVWSRETRSSYSLCDVNTGDAMRKFTLCRLLFLLSFNGICSSAVVVRLHHRTTWLVAWSSGRTSVFGRRGFAVLRSTCSW